MTETKFKAFGAKNSENTRQKVGANIDTLVSSLEYGLQESKKPINVQYIPIANIIFDKNNPRIFSLTIDEIKNGPKLDINLLTDDLSHFEQLVHSHFNQDERKIQDYLDIVELALSIKTPDNLINPITVRAEQLSFHLIAGHRRTLAHIILGLSEISATILNVSPGLDHSILQWKENKDRMDLSFIEQIHNLVHLSNEYEKCYKKPITARSLFELLGFKKAWAGRYLNIIDAYQHDNKFKQAIESKGINSVDAATLVIKMAPELKNKLLNEMIEGKKFSLLDLKKVVSEITTPTKVKVANSPIRNKEDINVYRKILNIILKNPAFSHLNKELENLNLDKKKDLQTGWEKIVRTLKDQEFK